MSGFDVVSYIREQNANRGYDNRARGEAFEFRVLRKYKRRSDVMFAIRSAGSHSPVDIIIQLKSGRQLWITCKRNAYIDPRERIELTRLASQKPANVDIILYYYITDKKMKWTKIA